MNQANQPRANLVLFVPPRGGSYLTGDMIYTLGDLAGRRFPIFDDGEIYIGVPF